VIFEYAPEPAAEYLNDRTAFDAFIEYRHLDGKLGFVGIETKLTEPFSPKLYDGPAYRRWVKRRESPWPETAWGRLAEVRHNQLWRDHLLATAMLYHDQSPYACGHFMLVRHPGDHECGRIVNGYRELLKPDDRTFIDAPMDQLLGVLENSVQNKDHKSWLTSLTARYLDLSASEEEWRRAIGSGDTPSASE
jgi:hypothetical protein